MSLASKRKSNQIRRTVPQDFVLLGTKNAAVTVLTPIRQLEDTIQEQELPLQLFFF